MRAHALPIDSSEVDQVKKRMKKGDFVPVCMALGMITLSTSLGLYTAMRELKDSPTVWVRKSRRETLPEVVEPEVVAKEAEKFVNKSLFRKIAHLQEFRHQAPPRRQVLIRMLPVEFEGFLMWRALNL